jgi:hypothetical protein
MLSTKPMLQSKRDMKVCLICGTNILLDHRMMDEHGLPVHTSCPRSSEVFATADVVSDIGTFMQNVGAAWLMVSLGAGPIYVALTQTASSLPYLLLALPAGSAGDIFDRRTLVLGHRVVDDGCSG